MNTKLPKKIYLNYCDENCDSSNYEDLSGITWCSEPVTVSDCDMKNREYIDLSQVWHDASEEPKFKNCWILVLDYKNKVIVTISGYGKWRGFVIKNGIVSWAYVDDILPKGGEK